GAIHHSDHGSTYTSWAFGHRLREAGLLGSMGTIGDCFDNSVAESFFATLQTELLDRQSWATREELANAVFAFIEGFYNPRVRGHVKVPAGGHEKSPRVASGSPHLAFVVSAGS
ncbi:MAG: Integrase, partial [Frankiales bacterium]|nr:Integrase [Frankiales bacterium]